ncbi:MAG: peptidylprolyl isomerase [Bacteroidia bacterium]|nr:peptidylprolyl isomerase [Bacteroidia bacterium]
MRKVTLVFALILLSIGFYSCRTGKSAQSSKGNSPALLTFDNGEKVDKSEFERVYKKNNPDWQDDVKGDGAPVKEYLGLYINFKRKVMEAEALGLDETDAFKKEFEGYRKQLAQPYLVEKKVQEGLIHEAYDRSKEFISASHILIMASEDAKPEDTLKAYKKILAIRDSIVNHGKDFATMAARHSQDPSAKQNKGYLGYFSAFDMVYPFETGAYNTPKGKVSQPVRTGYGYHLIYVKDRVPSNGKKSAAHIIIRIGPQYSAKDTGMAVSKINEIYQKLQNGGDFAELAGLYSDDPVTAKRGGDLGNGRLIPEMEELKIKLRKGEFSQPFNTAFGWHILKVTDEEPLKSFEESEPALKSRISKDARSYLSRDRLIERVKKENDWKFYQAAADKFSDQITQEDLNKYSKGFWRYSDSLHSSLYPEVVYTLGKGDNVQKGTLKDYMDFYVKYRKGFEGATARQVTDKIMEEFVESEVLRFEENQLPKKYPEYRDLVKEYRDGILLFTLTEDKVWRKAVEDTTGLKQYYADHKDKFQAGKRVVIHEYVASDRDALVSVEQMISEGKSDEEIEHTVNEESALTLKIRTLTYEQGKSEIDENVFNYPTAFQTDIMKDGDNYRIMIVKEVIPAGIKSFADAKSEAITQYQNYLESTWLAELEKKYPVKVDQKVYDSLFK